MPAMRPSDEAPQTIDTNITASVISGSHEMRIEGFSTYKGIGDGHPIASDVFEIGGHKWVLLFYPEGKKDFDVPKRRNGAPPIITAVHQFPRHLLPSKGKVNDLEDPEGEPEQEKAPACEEVGAPVAGLDTASDGPGQGEASNVGPVKDEEAPGDVKAPQAFPQRTKMNKYAAIFVAHYDQGDDPQGVYDSREGRAVRVCDRFELVAQVDPDYLPPGHVRQRNPSEIRERKRSQGGIQVLVDHKDPSMLELHGYGRFLQRNILNKPQRKFVKDDNVIIRYSMELITTTGGALQPTPKLPRPQEEIKAGSSMFTHDMVALLESGEDADIAFRVGDRTFPAHSLILGMQCPILAKLADGAQQAGADGRKEARVQGIKPQVFAAVLRYLYTDELPEVLGCAVEDLLEAAFLYKLERLLNLCERRAAHALKDDTAIPTLILANAVQADKLLDFCLEFIYEHITRIEIKDAYFEMGESHPRLMDRLRDHMNARKISQRDELKTRHPHATPRSPLPGKGTKRKAQA